MLFEKALALMKQGEKVKLPSWGGYWYWNPVKETIMIHTKDGEVFDIRETTRVEYTLLNICSNEWEIADYDNCPALGGEVTFSFGEAIKYLKRGLKVARKGWNGKGMYLFLSPPVGCESYETFTGKRINDLQPFVVMKAADDSLVPWLASQTDVLAEDWMFAE